MDIEREQRIRDKAYQYWLDEGNPDEWYNWFRATQDVDAEDAERDSRSLQEQFAELTKSTDPDATVTLAHGREIPRELATTESLSVSHRTIMRLLLHNQSQFAQLFEHYSAEDDYMQYNELTAFVTEFDLMPQLLSEAELKQVFDLVNVSEAADDSTTTLDSEEFTELVLRLGVFYGPSSTPLTREGGVMQALKGLLDQMNSSGQGKAFSPPLVFNTHKAMTMRK